jgi:hypothetical protein
MYYTGPPPDDSKSAIEWAGEWTVTYETFRDMGIAFGAALILIYILVVWEFGNFRIPALIMAPIPLTLLGIIPAHMMFFQFGWGGEFTATSMIGWIALAGIIVRNSILLVDFSVHRIQEGDSVVDAVITACKTRTRPILITALALVAGSSVIFFDPIFQGMAISLASGVLVSTILTLVVIPLGCVAAADSLCAVAGSTKCRKFPGGGGPEGEPGGPKAGPRVGDPLWVRAWSGFAGVLFTVIGAVAAIVGVVAGLFRSKRSKKAPVQARKGSSEVTAGKPAAPTRQSEARSGGQPRPESAEKPIESMPKPVAPAAAGEAKAVRKNAAGKKKVPAKKPTATRKSSTKRVVVRKAATPEKEAMAAAPQAVPESAAKAAPKSVAKAAPKPAPKPAVKAAAKPAKKRVSKPAAKAVSEPAAKPKPKTAPVQKSTAKPASGRATAPAKANMAATRKKTSGRRGIQLKSLGKSDGDGLN